MPSDAEIKSLFGQFTQARQRLEEALESDSGGDLKQDAAIQRFEFTYELLWKTFRKIARLKKVDCFTPRDAFSFAFKLGLIEDEGLFLEIIDARNKTSHVYSKEEAAKIYGFIRKKASAAFAGVEDKLDDYIKK
ncbi:MAG: HI0074 family nucleotidyltransferase substrate-binding subunit [Candidatus Omnitrophota bacterium]